MNWNIEYFRRADGTMPVREFLDGLAPKEKAKAVWSLDLLERWGLELGQPYVKRLVGLPLWELRIQIGGKAHRIFYVARVGRRFMLLHGFTKKTQKTPAREIDTALHRLKSLEDK